MFSMTEEGKHLCLYCGKKYDTKDEVDSCYRKHEIIFLPISTEDLHAIVNFIYTKEDKLLEGKGRVIRLMQRYLREKSRVR